MNLALFRSSAMQMVFTLVKHVCMNKNDQPQNDFMLRKIIH